MLSVAFRAMLILALATFLAQDTAVYAQQVGGIEKISQVDIIGHGSFAKRELMEVIETRESTWFSWIPGVDPSLMIHAEVRTDVLRLSNFYRDQGFLSVSVDTLIERQEDGTRIAFMITEGDPVLVDTVLVTGIDQTLWDPRSLKTVAGQRLTRAGVEEDRFSILSALRDSGYAFADVGVRSAIHKDHGNAIVSVSVKSGKRYRFGDLIVQGNRNVGVRTIRRGVTFRPGAPFEQRQVRDARLQLYRSGAFRSVVLAFPDSLATDSTVATLVTVSERSLRSAKLGAGYDSQNKVNGTISWTHRSVFGGAQKFKVELTGSAVLLEARASLSQPYIFGSRNWMDVSVSVSEEQRVDFSRTDLAGTVVFERNIAARTTLSFEMGGGIVNFTDSLFAQFATGFTNDRRDDFLDPHRGLFVQLFAQERGRLFKADEELLEFSGDGRWYRPLPNNSVLAIKVNCAVIVNLSKGGEVSGIDRLFGGGLSSVRGWGYGQLGPKDDNNEPIGGKSKFEASIEFRTKLGKYFGAALFVDTGNVDESFNAFHFGQMKWAAGGGVRYLSPVGPVRFDAGRRLSSDDTDLWQYHFSIGQAF
jgi:outer membrane protein assembly factor BamA